MQIARVTSYLGNLLETVLKTIDDKQNELGAERATSARALRDALRGYQVAHIGREQLNALVGALFEENKA